MNFLLRAASTGIKLCSQLHFCQSHQTAKETRMHAWVLPLQLWTGLMNHVPQRPLGHRQPSSDPLGTCTCAHMPVLLWAAHGISTSNEAWSPIWETGREKKVMVWFGVWHHCQGDGGCLVLSWFLASGLYYRWRALLGRCAHIGQSPEDIHAENTAGIRPDWDAAPLRRLGLQRNIQQR